MAKTVPMVLSALLLAAVVLAGCIDEVSNNATVTPSPTPTPEATPPSQTPTPEVTPSTWVKQEIHQDFDATPALAGLLEPGVSNITMEDIGFNVTSTYDVWPMLDTGKPKVPFIVKEFKIPPDSHVGSVVVNLSGPIEIHNIFIEPAPKLLYPIEYVIDNETYSSIEPYPDRNDEYEVLDHITWKEVVVHIFPIQYFPAESRIIAYKNASISIVYRVPAGEGEK
jgi:hypothetical protein